MGGIKHAINNLRRATLQSNLPVWNAIPFQRRAGVLALLYTDHYDQLSCMVTVRSHQISYGGDAALPGGKADSENETPYVVARREALEEVGLPLDGELPEGDHIEHLTTLPAYLSSRNLAVVPSVAYLSTPKENISFQNNLPSLFMGMHCPDEVHTIFSVPLQLFLDPPERYYKSEFINWFGLKFQQHYFSILSREKLIGEPGMLKLWGLTANILIDIARIAYGKEPVMPHRKPGVYGDQDLIQALIEKGLFEAPSHKQPINFRQVLGRTSPLLAVRNPN